MKLVVFDFDGTLVDSGECAAVATQKAFKMMGLPSPARETILELMGVPIELSFKMMGANSLSEVELKELFSCFRTEYKQIESEYIKPFPRVRDFLKIALKNYFIAIVSSKKTNVIHRNCDSVGIDTSELLLVGSDLVQQHYKPEPDGIIKALKHFSVSRTEAMYVGDAPVDIETARNAGVVSCAAIWGAFDQKCLEDKRPDHSVCSIEELSLLLEI